MCLRVAVIILSLCISLALARRLQLTLKADEKVGQLHSESMVLAETHQDTSQRCFSVYSPQLNEVTAQYQVAYDACLDSYEAHKKQIVNCYVNDRSKLQEKAIQSCSVLSDCQLAPNAYLAFACASIEAAEDAKIFYAIASNATDLAAKSHSDYLKFNTQRDLCITYAERSFVEDTTLIYGRLNSCLLGNETPNTPTRSTSISDETTTTCLPTTTKYTTTTTEESTDP